MGVNPGPTIQGRIKRHVLSDRLTVRDSACQNQNTMMNTVDKHGPLLGPLEGSIYASQVISGLVLASRPMFIITRAHHGAMMNTVDEHSPLLGRLDTSAYIKNLLP